MSVYITDVNKVALLADLWYAQRPAQFWLQHVEMPLPCFNLEAAVEAVKIPSLNLFCGRLIQSDLSGSTTNPTHYDRSTRSGLFAEIVIQVRENPNQAFEKVTRVFTVENHPDAPKNEQEKTPPPPNCFVFLCR
jgi:hypothetical protein